MLPQGADSWRLSAYHVLSSWAERPSLKEDLGSTSLSITAPKAKLALSAAQGNLAAQSLQAGPTLPSHQATMSYAQSYEEDMSLLELPLSSSILGRKDLVLCPLDHLKNMIKY